MKITIIHPRLYRVKGDQEVIVSETDADTLEKYGVKRTANNKLVFPDGLIFYYMKSDYKSSGNIELKFYKKYNKDFPQFAGNDLYIGNSDFELEVEKYDP